MTATPCVKWLRLQPLTAASIILMYGSLAGHLHHNH
jgi:hypothetical protein